MQGIYLENLTWPEAEAAFRERPVVVIPLGAKCKEHGLHLPLNNDATMAEYLARRAAERLPIIVAPLVPYSYFPAFVEYPGSAHLRYEVARDTFVDLARSFHAQGAKAFYALNVGFSTVKPLTEARAVLAAEGIVFEFSDFSRPDPVITALTTQPGGTHADEIETSMMMVMAPETVRAGRARPDFHASRGPGPLTRDPNAARGTYSPTGAYGDPTRATLEKGLVIVERKVALVEADLLALIEKSRLGKYERPPPAAFTAPPAPFGATLS